MTNRFNFFRKPNKFMLKEWEIWHTYSTYFMYSLKDVNLVAEEFIRSGFAEYACTSSGEGYWRSVDGSLQAGKYNVELNTDRQRAKFQLKTNDGTKVSIKDYSRECLGISVNLRYAELKLFNNNPKMIFNYTRAFLSPCKLAQNTFGITTVYPVITLYANGIILVHLRVISPNQPVDLTEFIEDYVNVSNVNFDTISVPPTVAKLLPLVSDLNTPNDQSIIKRLKLRRKFSQHCQAIDQLTKLEKMGDFEYQFADLDVGGQKKTITSLAHDLTYITGYLSSLPQTGLLFSFRSKQKLPMLGHHWSGHPHIYIVSHSQQARTASQNEELHKKEFSKILSRASVEQRENNLLTLSPSARPFEDYAVYFNMAATLWVWSKDQLKNLQSESANNNEANIICEHHTQVEVLEYGHMLYRSLIEQTQALLQRESVFRSKKELADLTLWMAELSAYGEIRDFLQRGWEAMGVELMKNHLKENLQILENRIALDEAEKRDLLQIYLALIFGIIAIPPFASEVVKPLWEFLNLWQFQNENLEKLSFTGVSVVFVILIIWMLNRYQRKV